MISEAALCVVEVGAELRTGGRIQVRAELSDGSALQLTRSDADLARMMKRLVDGFPDDRDTLSRRLLPGLLAVRAADQNSLPDIKVLELNRLLKTIINLPHQFSQSEAVLDFFEPSSVHHIARQEQAQTIIQEEDGAQSFRPESGRPMEQEEALTGTQEEAGTFRQEKDRIVGQEEAGTFRQEKEEVGSATQEEGLTVIQEEEEEAQDNQELGVLQSPLSEVLMSNGFCLANTETILYDLTPTTQNLSQPNDSTGRRASVGAAACLQLCHPSVSPPSLRGFTGMMGKLAKRRSFRRTAAPPP